jgi:WD40 repeat protein
VTAVAIAPDGTWLATGGNAARIWDVATGRERATLMGDVYRVEPVFSPEERRWLAGWLAAGAVREVVPLHYQETVGKHTRLTRPTGPVRAVAIAPDGTWLATGGGDGAVGVWHVAELRQRARFFGHTGPVSAVAFAPDGAWLATGGEDRSVRIWDLGRKRQRARLTGHTYPVKALAVAPDGTWLASASWGSVRIWDPGTGRQLARFAGAAGAVVAVAIAPDGARLATGCTNGSVQIWDVRTGRPAAMTRVDGEVRGCGWSPDGQLLFVGTDNGLHRFEYRNAATSSPVG